MEIINSHDYIIQFLLGCISQVFLQDQSPCTVKPPNTMPLGGKQNGTVFGGSVLGVFKIFE